MVAMVMVIMVVMLVMVVMVFVVNTGVMVVMVDRTGEERTGQN